MSPEEMADLAAGYEVETVEKLRKRIRQLEREREDLIGRVAVCQEIAERLRAELEREELP
jgi:hypothetical protein